MNQRPGMFRHWSDLLEPLAWVLGLYAAVFAVMWVCR